MQDQRPPEPGDIAAITICIAICTYNRLELLRALLTGLAPQVTDKIAVFVVDNGTESAASVVSEFSDRIAVNYVPVADKGLVAVRNKALHLACASGASHMAFIDDDEVPQPGWIQGLRDEAEQSGADLVFGPVLAANSDNLPKWVVQGGLLDKRGKTYGSGNVLIRLAALSATDEGWFQSAYGATGGEDYELFRRLERQGAKVTEAPDAIALEHVPRERMTYRFFCNRGFREGVVAAQILIDSRPGKNKPR